MNLSRYIRFGYVVPRVVGALLLYVLVEFGAGYGLRRAVIDSGQQALGAKVGVGDGEVSLFGAKATLTALEFANPSRPMENLLEADRLELDFDANSLLRGKAVADHAVLRGVRFGTPRETSGELQPISDEALADAAAPWLVAGAKTAATAWAEKLGGDIEGRLQATVDEFESPRLADELSQRWPARYEAVREEAEALQEEARAFRDDLRLARENPLRHIDLLTGAPERLQELTSRLQQVQADLATIPGEIDSDRQRIAAARKADEQRLRGALSADQLDPDSLTTQLLGDSVTQPLAQAIEWLRWMRQMTPTTKSSARATPASRGVDVRFVGVEQRPDFLIRTLHLDGAARIAGRPVELTGVVTGLTGQPQLHGEPMKLTLSTRGGAKLEVRASIDRSGDTPTETVHLDCPEFQVPQLALGPAAGLELRVDPSVGNLTISVQTNGDQIDGQLQLVQDELHLAPELGADASGFSQRLASAASGRLGRLQHAATRVDLSGSLDKPEVRLWSSLGAAVAESLRGAAEGVIAQEQDRLLAKSSQALSERMERFDEALAPLQDAVSGVVAGSGGELQSLAGLVSGAGGRGSLPFQALGKQLPAAGSLFR